MFLRGFLWYAAEFLKGLVSLKSVLLLLLHFTMLIALRKSFTTSSQWLMRYSQCGFFQIQRQRWGSLGGGHLRKALSIFFISRCFQILRLPLCLVKFPKMWKAFFKDFESLPDIKTLNFFSQSNTLDNIAYIMPGLWWEKILGFTQLLYNWPVYIRTTPALPKDSVCRVLIFFLTVQYIDRIVTVLSFEKSWS